MNLNQSTLVLFEKERSEHNFFPPDQSNSFYYISDAQINVFTSDNKFVVYNESGDLYLGNGAFTISDDLYTMMVIEEGTRLIIKDTLYIKSGSLEVYGDLVMEKGAMIVLEDDGYLFIGPDSITTIKESVRIVSTDSTIDIFGRINCHVSLADYIKEINGIYIDSTAVIKMTDIELGDRESSLTDYDTMLRSKIINMNTRGDYDTEHGRLGYTWRGGSPSEGSQYIQISTLYGDIVLGDYKFSVLGKQNENIPNTQIVQSLYISNGSTLHITSSYNGYTYLKPELYLGVVIDNVKQPADLTVDGTIIVDGSDSLLTVDRLSTVVIGSTGKIYLRNNSQLRSTNNDDALVLMINGQLIVDSIDQIKSFGPNNISFGENGKIIVLNPSDEYKVLFSTPHGKYDTDLYRIFEDKMDHVEYHVSPNTAIAIDEYYEYYHRDMRDWFAGRRIEKAVYDGILVWENGAHIELRSDIIPWATIDMSLRKAAKLFKSFVSFEKDRLQDVASRLKYAGFGNITFRVIDGDEQKDITLNLGGIELNSIINTPMTTEYVVNTNSDGMLFIKNKVGELTRDEIVYTDPKQYRLVSGDNHFNLT